MQESTILRKDRNCWRLLDARRVAFLVDADAYFAALAAALERAQTSIFILGWDIDSRARLLPDAHPRHLPAEFGDFLNALVSRRPGLHAYLLGWDFSVIYAFERELLPSYKLGLRTHRRVHFWLDNCHPLGASHHQKVVIIDDRVAFVGGLDIAVRRWDTPEHLPHDPRRTDPAGTPYPPFHDVQVMVDGQAAAALGELARSRWARATGERVAPPTDSGGDPWPPEIKPDFEGVRVGLARTEPKYNGNAPVAEVKQLYLDSIAAAQRSIYIENQYFTSETITQALAERLQQPDGPEILMLLPFTNQGWLEENTMGVLRAQVIHRLHEADRHDRLRLYYPCIKDAEVSTVVQVHSKVMVVDNRFLRIGSSNLNNRSMGLDTECDVAIEAGGDPAIAAVIGGFRDRLLGEHLGVEPERITRGIAATGSLLRTVDTLRGGRRTLTPIEPVLPLQTTLSPEPFIVDPERPVATEEFIAEFVPDEVRSTANNRLLRGVVIAVLLLGLATAWQWTPLGQWLDIERITSWTQALNRHPLGPVLILTAYVVGGLLLFPVTLLIIGTALTFDPLPSLLYAFAGCLLSATANYYLGRVLGRETVQRLAGPRMRRLNQRLIQRGLITMITVRALPIAPFSVVNIVVGALRIRLRHLLIGTFVGMAPGILAITVFTEGLAEAIRRPSLKSLILLTVLVALIVLVSLWLRRWLAQPAGTHSPAHK